MTCQRRKMCAEREEGNVEAPSIHNLPTEILFFLFEYFDYGDLMRLSCVCRRFCSIINEDGTWKKRSCRALVTNLINDKMKKRSCQNLLSKEKVRLSRNWINGRYTEDVQYILGNRCRYMPWLCLGKDRLWLSQGPAIITFQRTPIRNRTSLQRFTFIPMLFHQEDVCKFVYRKGMIISGGRVSTVNVYSADTGRMLFHENLAHQSDVTAVDYHNGRVVSGSRDRTLKVWRVPTENGRKSLERLSTIYNADSVKSLAMRPTTEECLVGTSGILTKPIHLFNLERGIEVISFDQQFLNGAGILDICWETPDTVLTTGYDTYVRLWDCRTGNNVQSWSDPFDSTVYCLASDHQYTIVSGTCNHGRVQLWDKRQTRGVQMFFVSSPYYKNCSVYSIAFDPCNLYVALDQTLNVLDFTGYTNKAINMNNWIC